MQLDRLRMIFGFLTLAILAALAGVIAIGHVEENSSFGLQYILGALSAMAGGFTQWAFSTGSRMRYEPPLEKVSPDHSQGVTDAPERP